MRIMMQINTLILLMDLGASLHLTKKLGYQAYKH